jgi:hypothetical protein
VHNTESEQSSQAIVQDLLVSSIQLCNSGKNERDWHVLNGVLVAAGVEGELVMGQVLLFLVLWERVADEVLRLKPLLNNASGEESEERGERKGPGSRYS